MSAAFNPQDADLTLGHSQRAVRDEIHRPGVKIQLELGPGTVLLLASPVAVAAAVLAGWVLLTSLAMPVFYKEMFAAAIVSISGGTLAALPLLAMMKRGVQAIARGALMGIAIRCGATLFGFMLAMGPGWSLNKMPLVYWLLACYFPVLIVETATIAWLCQKSKD